MNESAAARDTVATALAVPRRASSRRIRAGSARQRWHRAALLAAALFGLLGGSAIAQGMGPGGHMRDMMREMMRGNVPPPGMTPERLPEPDSDGARLVARYCVQCHDLPSPRYQSAAQWPDVFERMYGRMRMMSQGGMMGGGMMGMGHLEAPNLTDARTLLAYLVRNSMLAATPADLEAGSPEDRAAFREICTRCHVLPSGKLHVAGEWPGVIARMEANMQMMDRPPITPDQRVALVRYLSTAAKQGGP